VTIKKKLKRKTEALPKPGKRGVPNGPPLTEWNRKGQEMLALAAEIETLWANQRQWPIATSAAVQFIASLLRMWAAVWDSGVHGEAVRLHIGDVVRQQYFAVSLPYMSTSQMDRWWAVEKRLPQGVVLRRPK
jgi:hypothetical protein